MKKENQKMAKAKKAAQNWGQKEPTNIEEAKGITWGLRGCCNKWNGESS